MHKYYFYIFLILNVISAETRFNEYADLNREIMCTPASAALAGADMSFNSGAEFSSCPANLPYDTLNVLSLSYANFFQNTFSTSLLSFSGPVGNKGAIGISAGYIYVPDIEDTRGSTVNEDGDLIYNAVLKSSSDILVRFSYGYRFDLNSSWAISAGVAANARRARLIDYTGYGAGLDAGLKINHRRSGASLAILIENITSNYTYWNEDYKEYSYCHLRMALGIDRQVPYLYGRIKVGYTSPDLLANEGVNYYKVEKDSNNQGYEVPKEGSLSKNPEILYYGGKIGIEYLIMNRVACRFGLAYGKINFGAGVQLFSNRAGLDFAYTIHQLAGTYQVSMTYKW